MTNSSLFSVGLSCAKKVAAVGAVLLAPFLAFYALFALDGMPPRFYAGESPELHDLRVYAWTQKASFNLSILENRNAATGGIEVLSCVATIWQRQTFLGITEGVGDEETSNQDSTCKEAVAEVKSRWANRTSKSWRSAP